MHTQVTNRLKQPTYNLDALRELFPVAKEFIYMNHASVSPLATPIQQAQINCINRLGDGLAKFPVEEMFVLRDELYTLICQLINAEPDEVSLVQNTSLGLNIIAQGLQLPPGSNIILCDVEFPSNVYPWMNFARDPARQLEVRRIPADNGGLTVAALEQYADENTALITVSSLQYGTGHLTDLNAIGHWCRQRGILFCVDAIQSAGHNPIDVKAAQIDFLATGGMKSLLGPLGIGFMYIRRDLLAGHDPVLVGASSVVDARNFANINLEVRPEAARYELGTINLLGIAGLHASLKLLLSLGIANIGDWTRNLAAAMMDDLTQRGYRIITPRDAHGSIVIFSSPTLEEDLARLKENNVIVIERGGNIRASLHCYNTYEEIYRIGQILGDK